MDLRDGHGQRRPSIHDGVFSKQDDLAGGGGCGHVVERSGGIPL
jgi:hypothetical protein